MTQSLAGNRPAKSETCATCRCWDRYEGSLSTEVGDCRFNPPLISDAILDRLLLTGRGAADCLDELELNVYPASSFPVTHETSWCAQYQARGTAVPL